MQYIIEVLIIIISFSLWQGFLFLLRLNYKIGQQEGQLQATSHIFNQIKNTGKIEITLNGEKRTFIELKKK